jgi:hypothetical protein
MSGVGGGLEAAPTRFVFDAAGDDLVRSLTQLTKDVERFDSMIRNQRHLLQRHDAGGVAFDEKVIRRQSRRISAGAANIVTRTRGALKTLRGLSDIGELVSLETIERRHGGARAEDSPAR